MAASPFEGKKGMGNGTHDLHCRESINVDTGIDEKTDEDFRNLENDTMKDPLTGLTGHEKKMIWDSWKKMKSADLGNGPPVVDKRCGHEIKMIWDLDYWKMMKREGLVDSGKPLFTFWLLLWLFMNIPGMTETFYKFDANQKNGLLVKDPMFVAHAHVLVGELYAIIKLLPEPEELMSRISKLAETHVKMVPRVGEKYFKSLHDEIHLFVSWFLDIPEEDEVVQLWTKLFGLILESVKTVEANAGPELETEVDPKKEKQQKLMLEDSGFPTPRSNRKGCCLIL